MDKQYTWQDAFGADFGIDAKVAYSRKIGGQNIFVSGVVVAPANLSADSWIQIELDDKSFELVNKLVAIDIENGSRKLPVARLVAHVCAYSCIVLDGHPRFKEQS